MTSETNETAPAAPENPWTATRLISIALVFGGVTGLGYYVHRTVDDMTDFTRPETWLAVVVIAVPLAIAHVSMRLMGRRWSDYGLKATPIWRAVGLGVAIAAGMLALMSYVLAPLVMQYAPNPPDVSHLLGLRGDLPRYLVMLVVVWITAAFGEELIFRGFLLNEVAELFGRGVFGWIAAVVAIAVAFALGHAYQGLAGVLFSGSFGLVIGLVYLATGRNLWTLILAHGLIDTYSFTRIFLA
ncbi:hypothetical protein DDZ18_09005 [Marinicauda salina]|uniref:CAAX prenyl protease 2/Lysostaphin resistance protein A-like domain-containing protein n=1 Tax=Marinicauda salina TaxID=2135793 RepID=A0A2U2BUS4_9PROT|nr:CPBP family intramembrane glutamic endopeptidase [Marinicauda salina]PWE17781.1 hypothetical protein DDZ18_09005 [Marinicauda salina]